MLVSVRDDFPFLQQDPTPIYFDNACMTLRPRQVIDAIVEYYERFPVCGGRSVHHHGMEVTMRVQEAREAFRTFLRAPDHEVVFMKNTTEAINLVAKGYPFERGDRVLITGYEHNSNLVPWHQVSHMKGIDVVVVPPTADMTFDMDCFQDELSRGAAMVSVVHTSNLNGYTLPLREVVEIAHDRDVPVMVDGAQSAPHKPVALGGLEVDFFALSSHKMLGPTGLGALLALPERLEAVEPLSPGGGTIKDSSYTGYVSAGAPDRYEGGLQHYAGIIGAKAAIDYLSRIGIEEVEAHERRLTARLTDGLLDIEGVTIIPPLDPAMRSGITSFIVRGMNPHDVAILLDEIGHIMIRSGRHCVDSWFDSEHSNAWFEGVKVDGTCRASLYIYNTEEEVDIFLENVKGVMNFVADEGRIA